MNHIFPSLLLLPACWLGGGGAWAETVGELRSLSFSGAAAGRAVTLSGTVTYLRDIPGTFNFSLHDSTGGVMIYTTGRPSLRPGQQVTVRGKTAMDLHGLRINAANVEAGAEGAMPTPLATTMAEVRAGKHEGRFVEMEGVIRSVRLESPEVQPRRLALDFGNRSQRLTVWISHYPDGPAAFQPGTVVRVRGVVVHWRNPRGQPTHFNVLSNAADDAAILAPAPPALVRSIATVQEWDGYSTPAALVGVSGTVTYAQGGFLIMQEGNRAIRVHPEASNLPGPVSPPQRGDVVEVAGFPALGDYTVELEDARIRFARKEVEPVPEPYADAAAAIATTGLTDRDARLISLPATVAAVRQRDAMAVLEMVSGNKVFEALLPGGVALPGGVRSGSQLRLTGICSLELNHERRRLGRAPNEFNLLLRDDMDIRIVHAGPWWTPERLRLVAGLTLLALLLVAAWSLALRAKNRLLRREIAAREHAEHELTMERRRVSAELHDTLEQTLTAASLQLHAASRTITLQPAQAAAPLSLERQLIARSRQEVKDAVWDLRLDHAASASPAAMLRQVCHECSATADTTVEFIDESADTPLPAHHAGQLVRIAREAVNNALRHAAPGKVIVRLQILEKTMRLSIQDDGCGFASAAGPESGHFGLGNMQERMARLGGTFQLATAPGKGTTITLSLPLSTV